MFFTGDLVRCPIDFALLFFFCLSLHLCVRNCIICSLLSLSYQYIFYVSLFSFSLLTLIVSSNWQAAGWDVQKAVLFSYCTAFQFVLAIIHKSMYLLVSHQFVFCSNDVTICRRTSSTFLILTKSAFFCVLLHIKSLFPTFDDVNHFFIVQNNGHLILFWDFLNLSSHRACSDALSFMSAQKLFPSPLLHSVNHMVALHCFHYHLCIIRISFKTESAIYDDFQIDQWRYSSLHNNKFILCRLLFRYLISIWPHLGLLCYQDIGW